MDRGLSAVAAVVLDQQVDRIEQLDLLVVGKADLDVVTAGVDLQVIGPDRADRVLDVLLGLDTGVSLLVVLISLVAGLLFGDLLVPPRRAL